MKNYQILAVLGTCSVFLAHPVAASNDEFCQSICEWRNCRIEEIQKDCIAVCGGENPLIAECKSQPTNPFESSIYSEQEWEAQRTYYCKDELRGKMVTTCKELDRIWAPIEEDRKYYESVGGPRTLKARVRQAKKVVASNDEARAIVIENQNSKPLNIYYDVQGLLSPDRSVEKVIPAGEASIFSYDKIEFENVLEINKIIGSTGGIAKPGMCSGLDAKRKIHVLIFENKPWGTACKNVTNEYIEQ